MLHVPLENVGDRLDPPVRVPGESGQVFRGVVRAEIVEEQEGVEAGRLLVAEGPLEVDARRKKNNCILYSNVALSTGPGFPSIAGIIDGNNPSGVPECKGGGMPLKLESGLHVGKVVEITAASTRSFEDAIAVGIDRASKTLKNVQGAWVKEQKVTVKDGKIAQYRVDLKVTFLLEE